MIKGHMNLFIKIIFIFWSVFLFNCGRNDTNVPMSISNAPQEMCLDKKKCHSLYECFRDETCIDNLCDNPICISPVEACNIACGFSNCPIQESDPSSIGGCRRL